MQAYIKARRMLQTSTSWRKCLSIMVRKARIFLCQLLKQIFIKKFMTGILWNLKIHQNGTLGQEEFQNQFRNFVTLNIFVPSFTCIYSIENISIFFSYTMKRKVHPRIHYRNLFTW